MLVRCWLVSGWGGWGLGGLFLYWQADQFWSGVNRCRWGWVLYWQADQCRSDVDRCRGICAVWRRVTGSSHVVSSWPASLCHRHRLRLFLRRRRRLLYRWWAFSSRLFCYVCSSKLSSVFIWSVMHLKCPTISNHQFATENSLYLFDIIGFWFSICAHPMPPMPGKTTVSWLALCWSVPRLNVMYCI